MKKSLTGLVLIALTTNLVAQESKKTLFEIERTQKLNCEVYQLVYNPSKHTVYVAGPSQAAGKEGPHYVYELDASDLSLRDSLEIGQYSPFGIALNNQTQVLYVGHSRQNAISAIDLASRKQTLITNGKENSKIREIVVDETNNRTYVSDHGNPSIWEIDGKTNTYLKSFNKQGAYLLGLQVDPDRGKVYGTDGQDMEGNILVFNNQSGELENSYKTWSYCPLNIALDRTTNRIFVSQSNDNNITVVNGNTGEIVHKIYLGYDASPIGLVYDEKNELLYTANRGAHEVAVVNTRDYKILERVPTGGLPNTLTLDQKTGAVYVTNKRAGRGEKEVENANTVMKISKAL